MNHLQRINKKQAFAVSLVSATTLLSACKTSETPVEDPKFNHSTNVFAATDNWYANPVWSENAAAHGGEAIAHHNTAVWLHRIGEVEEIEAGEVPSIPWTEDGASPLQEMGLRDHLEAAEAQGNALVQLVINNAPGKECSFTVSYGELPASEYGMEVYQTQYIDRIAHILQDYPHIPIAIVLEPSSLTDLVKYSFDAPCMEVANDRSWGYTNAIRYTINTLSKFSNVHLYMDIGAANEFGWDADIKLISLFIHGVLNGFDDHLFAQAKQFAEAHEAGDGATGRYENIERIYTEPPKPERGDTSPPGYDKISGFASNLADYVPLEEPYLGDPLLPDGSNPLYSAYFYDWNPRFTELDYTHDWLEEFRSYSEKETQHLGVIIDTSRNGWGQAYSRLQDADITQDPDSVNEYRIDQREHRQNWCNVPGGLGKRPQAAPPNYPWVDAYVWVKQPGESDGISDPNFEVGFGPFSNNRRHEPMCDPHNLSTPGQRSESTAELNLGTDAMEDAPRVYQWFADGFTTYLENAWPPVCEGHNDQCEK